MLWAGVFETMCEDEACMQARSGRDVDKQSSILVTGANGHVGFNLVKMLMDDGYGTIRVSVRDASNPKKTSALKGIGVTDFVSLDIRDQATFAKVSEGIDVLFHVAATYRFHTGSADADAEMIRDSLDGARSAIEAAAKNGIEKVVLTSSIVTLPITKGGKTAPDESQWTQDLRTPYVRAKVEGEQLAWQLAKKHGVDLVTVLPGAVIGPNFGRGTQTIDYLIAIKRGLLQMGCPPIRLAMVDVRDVARVHILAAEQDSKGRFIVVGDTPPNFAEMITAMRKIDRKVPRSLMTMPRFMVPVMPMFDWAGNKFLGTPRTMTSASASTFSKGDLLASNARAKRELGWSSGFTLEQSLRDTMAEL